MLAMNIPKFSKGFSLILGFDIKDYWVVAVYSTLLGILSLAVPIAVSHLVNTVSFIGLLQPVIVLTLILVSVLLFAGAIHIIQIYTVEIFERRAYARMVEKMASRLPHIEVEPTEQRLDLSNRFIEILNLQKTIRDLSVEGIGLVLQTVVGLILLALYHPVFILFSFFLLGSVYLVFYTLRGDAIYQAADESYAKYNLFGWLQQVSESIDLFQKSASRQFNLIKTNDLLGEYFKYRKVYFKSLIRQQIGLAIVYVTFSASLLGVGGWLVISDQLSIGQLVAAEIILAGILSGLWKTKLSIEKFDDLWISFYKLLDLLLRDFSDENRPNTFEKLTSIEHFDLAIDQLTLKSESSVVQWPNMSFPFKSKNVISVSNKKQKLELRNLLELTKRPTGGSIELGKINIHDISAEVYWDYIYCVKEIEFFGGTLAENLQLFQKTRSIADVRKALQIFQLSDSVQALAAGLDSSMAVVRSQFSMSEMLLLTLARSYIGQPKVLVIDELLDNLSDKKRELILSILTAPDMPWTLIVLTEDSLDSRHFDQVFEI